jgi:YVTN family beta-propeller protein
VRYRLLRNAVVPLAVILAGFALARPAFGEERVYVGNTDSGTLSVISVPRLDVVGTVEIGVFPDDVTAARDGTVVYANRVQSSGHPLSKRAGESGEVVAVGTATGQVLWRAPVDGWPQHLALTPDGRRLYVPLYDRLRIDVVDTDKHAVVGRLPAAPGSHGMKLTPDGRRLYVGSMFMDLLLVLDLETGRIVKRVPFKDAVRPFAFTRDEKRMYVQLSRLHGFEVVDLGKERVVQRVHLPELPAGTKLPEFFPNTYNHGLALSPDEKLLFAAGSVADYVCVYSQPGLELLKTIPVGHDPNWIVFSKDGRRAFVSNRGSDTVSVIDVAGLREIKQIRVGKYPQRMAVADVPATPGESRPPNP